MRQNIFSYFQIAIECLNIEDCYIGDNQFYSVYPTKTEKGVILNTYAINDILGVNMNNTISDNLFRGEITYPVTIMDTNPTDTNIMTNNNYDQFYDYREEMKLIRL